MNATQKSEIWGVLVVWMIAMATGMIVGAMRPGWPWSSLAGAASYLVCWKVFCCLRDR